MKIQKYYPIFNRIYAGCRYTYVCAIYHKNVSLFNLTSWFSFYFTISYIELYRLYISVLIPFHFRHFQKLILSINNFWLKVILKKVGLVLILTFNLWFTLHIFGFIYANVIIHPVIFLLDTQANLYTMTHKQIQIFFSKSVLLLHILIFPKA